MALLILTSNESVGVSSGTYTVVGTRDGKETVTVAPGAKVTLDASFNAGGDSIAVSGNAGSYKAVSDGTQVILTDALGGTVTIPVGTTKSTVAFADASRDLVISGGALKLGNDTVGTTATTVTAGTGGTTPVVGQTFTLTTGANSIVGTSGDDFIDGSLGGAGGSSATLNSFDTINGATGVDTLFATVTGSTTSPRVTGVETLVFGASGTSPGTATIDLLNSSGYTSVENNSSNIPLTVQNISTSAVSAKISNTQSNTTFSWVASAVNGSSDSVSLTLSNVTSSPTITINSIETVNVAVVDAPSAVSAASIAAARVNVTGGQNVSLGTLNALTNYLDASQFTANVTATTDAVAAATLVGGTGNDVLTVSSVTGNVSVSAGGGDDTIIAALNLTLTDTIDGGSGSADVLQTTNSLLGVVDAATPTTYLITNIERLTVTDTFSGTAPVANVATGINTVSLIRTDGALTSGTATFQGPSSFTLNLGTKTDSGTNSGALGGALVVNSTGSGANDSLTINNLAVQTSTAVNVFASNTLTTGGTSGGVAIPAYENITINTGSATTVGTEAIGAISITPDAAASAVSLTLTGSNPVTIASATTTSTGTFTVSAAGMTAASSGQTAVIGTISTGTGGRSSVTGSGGNDTITVGGASTVDGGAGNDSITGTSAADSIFGNTGNDTIIGGGGNDTLSGGAGTDRIDVSSAAGNVSVSGGDGTDTIVFGGTLTSADTVDGGDGVDTISVDASTSVTSTSFTNVTSVEQVALTGTTSISLAAPLSSSGTTFDLSAATAQNITFASGYTGAVSVLATNGTAGNAGAVDVINNTANIALTVSGKLADVNNIQVVGGTGIDALVLTADSTSATLGNSSGIETITMVAGTVSGNTTGSATATLTNATSASGKTLTVDATALTSSLAAFSISGASSQLGSVSVTGGAGNDTLNLSSFAGGSTVVGGAGDDTINAGTGNDSLDGGSGNDAYIMGSNLNASDAISDASGSGDVLSATVNGLASATTGALRISGVETLNLSTSGAASTINAAAITGASRINIGEGSFGVTLSNMAAGTNLGLGFATNAASTSASTAYTGTLTFGLADSSGSSDAVSVTLNNTGSANAIAATLAAAAGIETVTINASTASSTASAPGAGVRLTVANLVVPSLVISGGNSTLASTIIDLRGTDGAGGAGTSLLSTSTTSVNASGLASSLRLNASASATQVTISGGGTSDSITGGAANDSFTIASASTTGGLGATATVYTIAGGAGTDSLAMAIAAPTSGTSTVVSTANMTAIENFSIAIPNSIATSLSSVSGLNTTEAVSATFTGGNSLSSLTIGTAIGSGGSAWKSFDASTVSGVVDVVVAPGALAAGATVRGGSGSSDVLRVTQSSTANGSLTTTAPVISGFETLVVTTSDDAGSQSFANATGLSTISVSGTNSYLASGLAAGVAINLGTLASGNTAAATFADNKTLTATLATFSGTSDSQTINLVSLASITSGITLALDGIETINLNMSSTVAGPAASLAITDTNTNSVNINLSGGVAATGRDVTFRSGGIQANVASINASSFVNGGMVMADGSRVGATAMTITGGSGNDTIIMKASADVLTGGSGTDTIKLTGSGVIGGYAIDLNSTTDQIVQYAGFANAAAQTGFENVDLAGVLGSFGADITGRTAAASAIVGTLNADNIVAGSSSDTITGGAGNDVINVGSGTDRLVYTASGQGVGTSGGIVNTTASLSGQELALGSIDIVTGMARGDQVQFASGIGSTLADTVTGTQFATRGTTSLLSGNSGSAASATTPTSFALVQGTYLGTGVFAVSSSGADMLFQWDTNGQNTTGGVEAVVLIGANTGTSTNITGIVASTAGVLTFV